MKIDFSVISYIFIHLFFKMADTDRLINPLTGRAIKCGSNVHIRLIQSGVMGAETLKHGKEEVKKDYRKMMPQIEVTFTKNKTIWTNPLQIAKELYDEDVFSLAQYFSREYDEMKLCITPKSTVIIFPNKELFIKKTLQDYIMYITKERNIDWND